MQAKKAHASPASRASHCYVAFVLRVDDNDFRICDVIRFVSGNSTKMSSISDSQVSGASVSASAGNIISAISVLFIMANSKYIAVTTISATNAAPNHMFPVSEATTSSPGSISQKLADRIRLEIVILLCMCFLCAQS